jgi:hypothetical protein
MMDARASAGHIGDHMSTQAGMDDPLSTKRRQPGILMHVHPVLRESLKPRTSSAWTGRTT